jgi:exosortase E/protease (VPEID-CTERM system)
MPRLVRIRLIALVVLLVAEVLLLELRFDTASLVGRHQWWAEIIGQASLLPHILIAIAVATVIFAAPKFQGEGVFARLGDVFSRPHRFWPAYLLSHVAVLAAFVALTAAILDGNRTSSMPGGWFWAWLATGAACGVLWGVAALPVSSWIYVFRRGLGPVSIAAGIGVLGWLAGELTSRLWAPLGWYTFRSVATVLELCVDGVFYDPETMEIGTDRFSGELAPACSGYEGIGLICVFLALYLWFYRRELRFPRALCLLPLGIALIWGLNVVRIASLVLIAHWGFSEIALGGFHSQAGWLAFNAVALGLVVVAGRWEFISRAQARVGRTSVKNPAAPYLLPFLAVLAVTMITRAFSAPGQPDWWYPLRVVAALAVFGVFWNTYRAWRWSWSWQAMGMGAAAFALWAVLSPRTAVSGDQAEVVARVACLPAGIAGGWWCFRALGYVITVPLAEELAFRGYLSRRLISPRFEEVRPGQFSWCSFLASSALFGAMHGGYWLVGTLAGMLFACAYYRRGELSDAVVAHATANGLLALYGAATGNWQLWS